MLNKITNNLKIFTVLITIYSLIFFFLLDKFISNQTYTLIPLIAITYGVAIFLTGLILGSKDKVSKSRYDLDFLYHLTTFIVSSSIGLLWILLFKTEELLSAFVGTISWGIGLLVHYLQSRNSLKGMDKEEVFK